jgi:hypothetical protein
VRNSPNLDLLRTATHRIRDRGLNDGVMVRVQRDCARLQSRVALRRSTTKTPCAFFFAHRHSTEACRNSHLLGFTIAAPAEAHDSQLPDESGCRDALNNLLVRVGLQNIGL